MRSIIGVKPAFVSRVSNEEVRSRAGQIAYSRQLLKQQLLLFGRVFRSPDTDELRELTFFPGSFHDATSRYVRRVGRPRNEWTCKLRDIAFRMSGGCSRKLECLIHEELVWKATVHNYINVKI